MIDVGNAIRKAVACEVVPLMARCEQIRADLDDAEDLSWIPDRHERAYVRVNLMMRRAELEAVLSGLRGTEDRVLRFARERWPSWRI